MGWERQGEVGRLKKKKKLLRRDITGRGVLAEDRPGWAESLKTLPSTTLHPAEADTPSLCISVPRPPEQRTTGGGEVGTRAGPHTSTG